MFYYNLNILCILGVFWSFHDYQEIEQRNKQYFSLKIAKNLMKGLKEKNIILLMFKDVEGTINIINRFRSPENLRNDRKWG